MPYLIGLGIIMAIIGINSLYMWIKERQEQKQPLETALEEKEENILIQESAPVIESSINPGQWIESAIRNEQYIFGLPLQFVDSDEEGKIIALDRQENIYLIETKLRRDYDDLYDQVMADMEIMKKRMPSGRHNRQIYGIICTNKPSERLKNGVKENAVLRIFGYNIQFYNIL